MDDGRAHESGRARLVFWDNAHHDRFMPEEQSLKTPRRRRWGTAAGIALLVLFSPVILLVVAYWVLQRLALRIALLVAWAPRGRRVLFVYSDSPVWGEYIRARMLPRLPANAVVLNWSERSTWRTASLAVWAFRHYGGRREFNPLGLLIPTVGKVRIYRFWRPFREFKHGKPESLVALEARFFDDLAEIYYE
jgi:hypothetical protein